MISNGCCDLVAALLNSYVSECPPTELSNCLCAGLLVSNNC